VRGFSNNNKASFLAIEQFDGTTIRQTLEASDVSVDPETSRWTAQRYIIRTTDEDGRETFKQLRDLDTLISLDVRELGRVEQTISTMKIGELNRFLAQQRMKGSDSINLIEVERHTRYAYPMATFILTLIGVSLSSRKVRGGTGLHIGIGITLCFTYIMFNRVFEEFAKSGGLPVGLAVWIPNIIFAIVAVYLYRKAPK
jgi:lipopolysaccharide export system permease protein